VFSSSCSLISTSLDRSVKFWKIGALSKCPDTTNQQSSPSPILSVSLQASAGIAVSSDTGGLVEIWDISTGFCKETFQIPAAGDAYTGHRDAKLIDGRLIFVWHKDDKIYIWDTKKRELLQTLDTSWCLGLRISGDGSKILCLHDESIQAWSMWTWEPMGEMKFPVGLDGKHYLETLSIDISGVWIHSKGSSSQEGWDHGVSGSSPIPFHPSTGRPQLSFMGDALWHGGGPH
jgi:WD40 repeat protein